MNISKYFAKMPESNNNIILYIVTLLSVLVIFIIMLLIMHNNGLRQYLYPALLSAIVVWIACIIYPIVQNDSYQESQMAQMRTDIEANTGLHLSDDCMEHIKCNHLLADDPYVTSTVSTETGTPIDIKYRVQKDTLDIYVSKGGDYKSAFTNKNIIEGK